MSKFWSSQPVDNGEDEGEIVHPKFIANTRLPLTNGLEWDIEIDPDKISTFLMENYVEDISSNFRLFYSPEFFKFLFSCPSHKNKYSLSIKKENK